MPKPQTPRPTSPRSPSSAPPNAAAPLRPLPPPDLLSPPNTYAARSPPPPPHLPPRRPPLLPRIPHHLPHPPLPPPRPRPPHRLRRRPPSPPPPPPHLLRPHLLPPHLPFALHLHSHLPHPSPPSANLILHSLARLSRPSHLLHFFSRSHILPNASTLPLLVSAAKLLSNLHMGESFHSLALRLGFLSHLPVSNSLLHMYASCDALDLARQLFDEMPVRDRISYHSVIDGFIQSGDMEKAEAVFSKMPDRNVVSYSTLINGYVRKWMYGKAFEVYRQMMEKRVDPDDSIAVNLLVVYRSAKMGLYGRVVHGYVVRKWSQVPTHVSSAIVDCYCKCGMVDAGVEVFERIQWKDLIGWNSVISGLGGQGRGVEAVKMFVKMVENGMKPDDITFIGVLIGCAHSGLVEAGLRMFELMRTEYGIKPSFAHYWCLVDLFVRVGQTTDALKVIQDMPLETLSAVWSAVIWIARVIGDISVGEKLGRHLIELEPDNSKRYAPLANLYAAASRWDKYKELQSTMKERGLKKLPNCKLIDLNVVAHKFSVGDKSQPEIKKIYEVLEKVTEQLKLQPCKVALE